MSLQDPISDMFVRIKNAAMRKKNNVLFPYSTFKESIMNVLKEEGYINSFKVETLESDSFKSIKVDLKYFKGEHAIKTIKRVSKPSLRIYKSCGELPVVNQGLGIAIVSTSKGVMTARAAKSKGNAVGGEVIVEIF
jgi:small subunit ribosomal protein S8